MIDKSLNDFRYEDKQRLHYNNQLENYKDFLSKYYWHLHVTMRHRRCSGKNEEARKRRDKIMKKYLEALRKRLGLKGNQLLYAYVHEYNGGGHVHCVIQFRKNILTTRIFRGLAEIKKKFTKIYNLEIWDRKQHSNVIFVESQENVLNYITKRESGEDKWLTHHPKLMNLGMSYDIFDDTNKAARML